MDLDPKNAYVEGRRGISDCELRYFKDHHDDEGKPNDEALIDIEIEIWRRKSLKRYQLIPWLIYYLGWNEEIHFCSREYITYIP